MKYFYQHKTKTAGMDRKHIPRLHITHCSGESETRDVYSHVSETPLSNNERLLSTEQLLYTVQITVIMSNSQPNQKPPTEQQLLPLNFLSHYRPKAK